MVAFIDADYFAILLLLVRFAWLMPAIRHVAAICLLSPFSFADTLLMPDRARENAFCSPPPTVNGPAPSLLMRVTTFCQFRYARVTSAPHIVAREEGSAR